MISDWGDVLILASHYAYGNDIFCTADQGKGSGSKSPLHHLNRPQLRSQGIDTLGPNELLAKLRTQKQRKAGTITWLAWAMIVPFPMSRRHSRDGSGRKACRPRGPARVGYWCDRACCGSRRTGRGAGRA